MGLGTPAPPRPVCAAAPESRLPAPRLFQQTVLLSQPLPGGRGWNPGSALGLGPLCLSDGLSLFLDLDFVEGRGGDVEPVAQAGACSTPACVRPSIHQSVFLIHQLSTGLSVIENQF